MAIQAFKVLTEFRFDVAQAVVGSDKLKKSIKGLSDTADQAVRTVENLGLSFALSFSGATGGIIGMLGQAVKSSDKFKSSQIELANIIMSNKMLINGAQATYDGAMGASAGKLEEIIAKARKLGISPDVLVGQTKMFANMLGGSKGFQGDVFKQSTELARVSMKASPALGVSDQQAQMGIMSGLEGSLSKNTQFGRRLFMEAGLAVSKATQGMVTDLKSFNKASKSVRITAMVAGLDKLAGSTRTIQDRAKLLSSQLMQLKSLFFGLGSILKPLGDAILKPLTKTLSFAIDYLKKEGASLVSQMGSIIGPLIENPMKLYIGFKQMSELSSDVGKALATGGLLIGILHLSDILKALSTIKFAGIGGFFTSLTGMAGKIPLLGKAGSALAKFSHGLFGVAEFTGGGMMAKGLWVFKAIAMSIVRLAGFVGILLIPLQGLSRALERIKADNAFALAKALPEMLHWLNVGKNAIMRFIKPITDLIGGFEELFYWILGGDGAVTGLKSSMKSVAEILDDVSMGFLKVWASMKAMIAGITAVVASVSTGNFSDLGGMFADSAREEFLKNMNQLRTPTLDKDGKAKSVSSNVTNQHITMKNNFKEVLQPDRIAFTIKDQLQKSARNATQTTSGSGNVFGTRKMAGFQRKSF